MRVPTLDIKSSLLDKLKKIQSIWAKFNWWVKSLPYIHLFILFFDFVFCRTPTKELSRKFNKLSMALLEVNHLGVKDTTSSHVEVDQSMRP